MVGSWSKPDQDLNHDSSLIWTQVCLHTPKAPLPDSHFSLYVCDLEIFKICCVEYCKCVHLSLTIYLNSVKWGHGIG